MRTVVLDLAGASTVADVDDRLSVAMGWPAWATSGLDGWIDTISVFDRADLVVGRMASPDRELFQLVAEDTEAVPVELMVHLLARLRRVNIRYRARQGSHVVTFAAL